MEQGLLINATHGNVIRLLPALNLLDEQVDEGCAILLEALRRSAL
jgi:acetylornithine/succinyldiaminopimelate/putrescine aminotransferase